MDAFNTESDTFILQRFLLNMSEGYILNLPPPPPPAHLIKKFYLDFSVS